MLLYINLIQFYKLENMTTNMGFQFYFFIYFCIYFKDQTFNYYSFDDNI